MRKTPISIQASLLVAALISACAQSTGSNDGSDDDAALLQQCTAIAADASAACDANVDDCDALAQRAFDDCADVDARADFGGIASWAKSWATDAWIDRGNACLQDDDLGCLQSQFNFVVRVWRYALGYKDAANALERYVQCTPGDYEMTWAALSKEDPDFEGGYGLDSISRCVEIMQSNALAQMQQRVRRGEWSEGRVIQMTHPGISCEPREANANLTVGRMQLEASSSAILEGERITVVMTLSMSDHYDFHPMRTDTPGGQTYATQHPYTTWAARLAEAGSACEFDVKTSHLMSYTLTRAQVQ